MKFETYEQIIKDIESIYVNSNPLMVPVQTLTVEMNNSELNSAYAKCPVLVHLRGRQLQYEVELITKSS